MKLEDLDLDMLTDQYAAYLAGMQMMHLEIAGEYLAELATLLEYKSRLLLPAMQGLVPSPDASTRGKEQPRAVQGIIGSACQRQHNLFNSVILSQGFAGPLLRKFIKCMFLADV